MKLYVFKVVYVYAIDKMCHIQCTIYLMVVLKKLKLKSLNHIRHFAIVIKRFSK